MAVVNATSIRDTLTARIKAIGQSTLLAAQGAPRETFRVYDRGAFILDEEPPNVVDRAFWVQIGESTRTGLFDGAEVNYATTIRVIVLYVPIANHELQEERVRVDARLIVNKMLTEVVSEIPVIPDRIGEAERNETYWRLVIEGTAQHSEAAWSAT